MPRSRFWSARRRFRPALRSRRIDGRALPLPKARLAAIAVLGDTGCRLNDARVKGSRTDHDHHERGQFQDCDRQSKWPFARLSAIIAAHKPDLVIHVGDYVYRESPCPPAEAGCKGSPHGDNWQTWKFTLNRTLQEALKSWNGKLPGGIDLAISGHMHIFETLSFADGRSSQVIIGTGGTALDRPITRRLRGMTIGTATVTHSRVERAFGFALLTPDRNGTDWTLRFVTAGGRAKFSCRIKPTQAVCR